MRDNLLVPALLRTPILIGESGATVYRVRREDGAEWIEKAGLPDDIEREVAVLRWCKSRLPVPDVINATPGLIVMSVLTGVDLTEVPTAIAAAVMAEALRVVHAVPVNGCPFDAGWNIRVEQAQRRVAAGLVDEDDFDEDNQGRTAADILAELVSLPLPPPVVRFTHGDACLPNFLASADHLTGIVDVGRAGLAHPAQDWALALRSLRDNRGADGEQLLRQHLPDDCADEHLLRQFRLLDELF